MRIYCYTETFNPITFASAKQGFSYPTYGSPMPMRRNLVQCSVVFDTTISNIYALNDTFNGSGNTGSFVGAIGTTVSNPSGNELEVSSTTVYPVISSTISTTTGKEYIVSADLNGMTSSPGYTASLLCEVIESGVTVASQSTTAPGNFNFTYTAGAGSASVRYTFVLTPNPGPPPPPPMAPFSFNLDNALVYFIDTAISSETVCVSKNGYRYGFNGKRIDENEEGMGGGGSTYDYGFRIYNPGLGRFLSIDPLFKEYPWYTPYQFAGNKIIVAVDLDGLEEYVVIVKTLEDGTIVKQIYYIYEDDNLNTSSDGKAQKPVTKREIDPLHPEIGKNGVEYRYVDSKGNVTKTERFADFIPNSFESYVMNLNTQYFDDETNSVKSGTRKEAMGKHNVENGKRSNTIYSMETITESVIAMYDNESNKMKSISRVFNKVLNNLKGGKIQLILIGYTDKDPMIPYISKTDPDGNLRLSKERSEDVKNELIKNGAASGDISTEGRGSSASNKDKKDPNDRKVIALQYSKRT